MAIETMLTNLETQLDHGFCSLHFARTLWLFTASDHKTFVLPQAAFGILGALSGPLLTTDTNPKLIGNPSPYPACLLMDMVEHTRFHDSQSTASRSSD